MTGHTFTGHTLACAAGVAVQKIVKRDQLLVRVRERGDWLRHRLQSALSSIDEVGDVRGRGYFIGIELVADRQTKAPFAASVGVGKRIVRAAAQGGLLCYPSPANVDGINGDTLILAPPYNTTDEQLEEIVEHLTSAVKTVIGEVRLAG